MTDTTHVDYLDPPQAPDGWMPGPPDFVGVGADLCGTTWWHRLISAHPSVATVPGVPKEVHFFDRFWDGSFTEADIGLYHSYFPRPGSAQVGEWTPRYMYDVWTPSLLERCAPQAKLLVSLRDPLDRYRARLRRRGDMPPADRWIRGTPVAMAVSRSLYADPLLRVLRHFPREQLLVLQYERCAADPEGELRRTYEFLGLPDADFSPPRLQRRDNPGRSDTPIPPALEDGVVEAFAHDAGRLLEIVPDLDLDLWPGART
jgi:hypothetical protein